MCFITCSRKSLVVFNVPTLVLMTRLLTNMSVLFCTLAFIPFVFPGSCQGHWGQDTTEFRLRSLLDSFVSKSGKHLHKRCKSVRLRRSVRKLNTFFRPLGWNCYLNKLCCWLTSHNEMHKDFFCYYHISFNLFWVSFSGFCFMICEFWRFKNLPFSWRFYTLNLYVLWFVQE